MKFSSLPKILAVLFAILLQACQPNTEPVAAESKQLFGAPKAAVPAKIGLCSGCHGQNGRSILPSYPHLAGQQPQYLVKALKAYRSGERKSNEMAMVSGHLTDLEIEELARYYAEIVGDTR